MNAPLTLFVAHSRIFKKLALRLQAALFGVLLTMHSGCGWSAEKFNIQMVVWRGVTEAEQAFIHSVTESGLTEQVQVWDAVQDPVHLQEIRRQILAKPPNLLYLFGTTVTLAFAGAASDTQPRDALHRVPMIFNIVADPVGSGITKDYGPTGRNLTGISHSVPLPVQAKIISDLGVTKIAALFNPMERNSAVTLAILSGYLHTYHITLSQTPIAASVTQGHDIISTDWHKLATGLYNTGIELVYLPSDSLVISHAAEIVAALHQVHMPTFSATEDPISKAGALMGVISHYAAAGRHAGAIAEQILRQGVDAGTIPIATPTHYLFLVNETSMRQLAYYPPIPLLQSAEFITRAATPTVIAQASVTIPAKMQTSAPSPSPSTAQVTTLQPPVPMGINNLVTKITNEHSQTAVAARLSNKPSVITKKSRHHRKGVAKNRHRHHSRS